MPNSNWDFTRRYFADDEQNRQFGETVLRLSGSKNDTTNPGALLILGMVCGKTEGNFELTMAYYKIIELRGWTGPRLWEVWKDECGQEYPRFHRRMMGDLITGELGTITIERSVIEERNAAR
jgi:hypothetical protein